MVKVELSYNPYLMETTIKFNGKNPRINSLVEKYQENVLQTWINKIPSIFYDEMNGYDFELEFSGTAADYADVKKAFLEAGVDETKVKIFHKNELDCRYSKVQLIEKLLEWLEKNRNRKFEYVSFVEDNEEKLQNYYSCVVVNGFMEDDVPFEECPVAIEKIEDIHELDKAELYHTPLVVCLDKNSLGSLKDNLQYILSRKDVEQEQLFFIIQSALNTAAVERTIKDLGVVAPKLITSVKDDLVKKYLEIYPVTDYIYKVIKLLRNIEMGIETQITQEIEQSEITNREIHERIDELEDILKRLKVSAQKFTNRDNFELPANLWEAKAHLLASIMDWKNKKIKITRESDAISVSKEFEETLKRLYSFFVREISDAANVAKEAIQTEYKEWYQQAKFDTAYVANTDEVKNVECDELPVITEELLELKEERYVMPKEDIFGRFFKASDEKKLEPVLEVTYYYQKWREYAAGVVEPLADAIVKEYETILKKYSMELAEKYQTHLEELIKGQSDIKEGVSVQLSDDELKLQNDNDWLVEFQDQLRTIERG